MAKAIEIKDLRPKGFTPVDIQDLEELFRILPIGGRFSIILSRDSEGTQKMREYEKISGTQALAIRNYEYS